MKSYPMRARIRNEGAGLARVDIFDDIGQPSWFSDGLTAKDFAEQMAKVSGRVEAHVNSGGGDVFDGIAIANALRAHKGGVTVVVDGLAASIASVIAQAGDERVAQPGSMYMIHDAFGGTVGNADEMRQFADTLDKVSDNIASQYAKRSGTGDAASWRDTMRAETWYTAEEAVAAGLADRVGGEEAQLPPALDIAAFAGVPGRIAAALRTMPRAAAGGDAPACKTCDGKKRLPHPGTGKNGMTCPGCAGTGTYDPDDDGDDDGTADGDTDHDYVEPDGSPGPAALAWPQLEAMRAVIRDELLAYRLIRDVGAEVDNSPWDGPKAMANGSASDDPEAFFKGICAGRTDGDASTQDGWALPYKYHPDDPPNAAGVKNALARLPQTQGLANEAEAAKTLQAAMKQVNPDYEPEDSAGAGISAADALERYRAALKGATA